MSPFSRILVPTDFGVAADAAFAAAISLARSLNASVRLLHVAPDPVFAVGSPELYGIDPVRLRDEMVADAQPRLWSIARTAPDVNVSCDVLVGRPADTIARAAKASGAGLIVMGTHGRGALGHLLVGSVADRVIKLAPCPVMTVREFGAVRLAHPEGVSEDQVRAGCPL